MSSKPYILFYSNKCKYSSDVLKRITTTPTLNSSFLYVNIDNKSYQLPRFVDRVPLIFIKDTKELIIDDNVLKFIQMISPSHTQSQSQAPQNVQDTNLESLSDLAKGISSSYSFMDEKQDKLTPTSYVYINDRNTNEVDPSRSIQIEDETRGNKIDSAGYDAYKNQRDLDMANFFPRR